MLTLQHIYKSFDENIVLDDISLSINPGDVTALIGENGAGKTTLLKILLGEMLPNSGVVQRRNESVGYVAQETQPGRTIEESFMPSVEPWRRDYALEIVGLRRLTQTMQVKDLSGGQKTRLTFAHVLAQDPEPTILLLDEPTNNLDTEGLAWLKTFIKNFNGAVLLVSHDRTFINNTATSVIELRHGKLHHYGGNYDDYRAQKESERRARQKKYEETENEKKRVRRLFREAQTRAKNGLSNVKPKDNDKMGFTFHHESVQRTFSARAKALQSRLDQIEEIQRPEPIKHYQLSLSGESPRSKRILQLINISKAFHRPILMNINLTINGSERVQISGPNGSGKTTLLKIASGTILPDTGEVKHGYAIRIGYFSQDSDGLQYEVNALENLQLPDTSATDIFGTARRLGLTPDDLKKRPAELSRGQQAKLAFAKLLLGNNHLLILDEPTNHLDIPTRERIEAALQDYQGAVLLASHDDYFVQQLAITSRLALS